MQLFAVTPVPQAADGLTPPKPVPAGLIATDVVTGESFGSAFDAADAAAEGSSLADLVADASNDQDMHLRLSAGLANLDERSRDILQQRWLSDDKATLHELAAEYGVSAERIRQLEKNAMIKLKTAISA